MRQLSIRILTATLTFIIGLGCGSIWMIHRYSEEKAKAAIPAKPSIPSDTFISLERTGCYGTCPQYTLAISADGTVVFSGSYVREKGGTYEWKRSDVIKSRISEEQVGQLIAEFEKANYFSLQDRYRDARDGCPTFATDGPSAYTAIQINGQKKAVEHYLNCLYDGSGNNAYPKELTHLEEQIDEIVNTKQWMQS
jgi:hypothetical protein